MGAYQQLTERFENIAHCDHLLAIAGWDEAVMMPPGGGPQRAEALATLQGMRHDLLTAPDLGDLIQEAQLDKSLDNWQSANLAWMKRLYLNATCLPKRLVQAITQANIKSEQAWRQLRHDNNWHEFSPLLTANLELAKESATLRSEIFNLSPYDVLIDEFSPGINQALIDPIFQELGQTLPTLIENIIETQAQKSMIKLNPPFPIETQKQLSQAMMKTIGFDFNHGRLDISHHPFCGGTPQDVRITTRYNEQEFLSALLAICHETGHACYEQNLPQQWSLQPVGRAHSMTTHESQSLLIEMQACRSLEFMAYLAPQVHRYFGHHASLTAENLYKLATHVKKSYIRVDADEATYPLHIIIRYQCEKQLIAGQLTVDDLPEAWDNAMQKYLGLSTQGNFRDGVMQDVHWAAGLFGYFPAYTLGALTAAQLFDAALRCHPDIKSQLAKGSFVKLINWLKENIHNPASAVNFQELLTAATGQPLSAKFFINHLQQRYLGTKQ